MQQAGGEDEEIWSSASGNAVMTVLPYSAMSVAQKKGGGGHVTLLSSPLLIPYTVVRFEISKFGWPQ